MCSMRSNVLVLAVSMVLASVLPGCGGDQATVTFTQWVEPTKKLPEDIKTIAVVPLGEWMTKQPTTQVTNVSANIAVIVGSALAENETFDVSGPASELIMQTLQQEIARRGLSLQVVDRETFNMQLKERDLAISDLVNPEGVVKQKGMLPVDALLVAKSTANSKVERVTADTFSIGDISRAIRTDGRVVETSEKQSVARTISVTTSFRLTNATTGQVVDSYSSPKSQRDKARPGFIVGQDMSEADLPPGHELVHRMVEAQVQEFLGQLVGVERPSAPVRIAASQSKDCQMGVRYLNSQSWGDALESFKRALAENPSDLQASFGAGVASEMMGQNGEALTYYQAAQRQSSSSVYADAVKRVRAKADREKNGAARTVKQ